jgi:hypothetical protein
MQIRSPNLQLLPLFSLLLYVWEKKGEQDTQGEQ